MDIESIIAGAPAPDLSGILGDLGSDPVLSPEELERVAELSGAYVQGFVTHLMNGGGAGLDPSAPDFGEKLLTVFAAYAQTDEARSTLDAIADIAGKPVADRLERIARAYVSDQLAPYMAQAFTGGVRAGGREHRPGCFEPAAVRFGSRDGRLRRAAGTSAG